MTKKKEKQSKEELLNLVEQKDEEINRLKLKIELLNRQLKIFQQKQ